MKNLTGFIFYSFAGKDTTFSTTLIMNRLQQDQIFRHELLALA